jgi:hypothetical protein
MSSKLTDKKLIGILSRMKRQKCYCRSLLLYNICRFFDCKSNYRINIMMQCFDSVWGHAWLTRNGKTFLIPNRNILPHVLEKIGENNRYIFWIAT